MSALDPRRQDDDPDLHRGFDRELDLAAERPWADPARTRSSPGLMVAAIVVSSLGLAGLVTLVRDAQTESMEPEAAESPQEAAVEESPAAVPQVAEPSAERQPVEAPVPRSMLPAAAMVPASSTAVPSPPLDDAPTITPVVLAPAPTPSVAMSPQPEDAASTSTERGQAPLPAPTFAEPSATTPAPEPAPPASTATPLPGVDEPSLFDADEPDADEPAHEASTDEPAHEVRTDDESGSQRDASAAAVVPAPLPV